MAFPAPGESELKVEVAFVGDLGPFVVGRGCKAKRDSPAPLLLKRDHLLAAVGSRRRAHRPELKKKGVGAGERHFGHW